MQSGKSEKIVAVFPEGGDAAAEKRYVCCVENALNLRDYVGDHADLIVTADKEGSGSGMF